jgi:Up-regulated During Septation
VWKNGSDPINTRDELLMMLLTSQAVLDSREFEILSAEEVDDLKKVRGLTTYYPVFPLLSPLNYTGACSFAKTNINFI